MKKRAVILVLSALMLSGILAGCGGPGKTVNELKKLCPGANWKNGRMLNRASDRELADWAGTF